MHPCLNIDEILRLIACELVAAEAKGTAVSLACCRKSLQDPVLDVLWESQDRLLPLLKTLPEDIWEAEADEFVSLPMASISSLPNCFTGKDFQNNPDKRGMDHRSKTRSEDEKAHNRFLPGPDR